MDSERRLGKRRRVNPDKWYAYIATPAYDGKVDCDYSQSLAESSFCAPLYQVGISVHVFGNGAFIDLARNIAVKIFLEENEEATHLFFIDSDLKFPANAFIGLIRSGLPICAGVYRRREEPENYPVTWTEDPDGGGLWVKDDWLMCDRVPTGFLCISRKVLEEMAADAPKLTIHGQKGPVPRLFYTKVDDQNRFVGEDFCFCDDYIARYKEPIAVWPDIDFTHGGYKGNFHQYLNQKAEEQKKTEAA